MERRGRTDVIIILILMIIIAAVLASWLTGLWSCGGGGRRDLTEQEKLTIADYINSVSVLVQHSNKNSINFFTTLKNAKDISRDELDLRLSANIEESRIIFENSKEMNPPQLFDVANGYLTLVFQSRNKSYEVFKPALFNIFAELDFEKSSSQIAESFIFMFMSDEIYKYFQDEIRVAGENIGISNLTIIDSIILEDKGLLNTQNVNSMITGFKAINNFQERRGVAVIPQSAQFNPVVINEHDQYLIIRKGPVVGISVNIENQGNVAESDVPVKATYKVEGVSAAEVQDIIIELINPSEQKTAVFNGFKAHPGKRCELIIEAGPVENEVLLTNNIFTYKFMMEN